MKTNKIIIIFLLILFIMVAIFAMSLNRYNTPKVKTLNFDNIKHFETIDDTRIFYSCLEDNDKALYELFLDLVKNKDVTDYHCTVLLKKKEFEKLTIDHFWNVYYAMVYDYPEYYYLLTGDESRINGYSDEAGDYTVLTFSLSPAPSDENENIEKFEKAADEFLADIDLSAPKSAIELQIHDKLIEEVSYDYELYESGYQDTYPEGATAYGALVSHLAICSGYSSAFQYLLQRAGIPCAYVSGTAYYDSDFAENSGDNYDHAWNLVKLDGAYYEVDTTWDDVEFRSKEFSEKLIDEMNRDDEKKFNVTHAFYNLTTDEIENFRPDESTVFYIDGYEPYNPLGSSHHFRGVNSELDTDVFSIYLNNLLPEALGEAG